MCLILRTSKSNKIKFSGVPWGTAQRIIACIGYLSFAGMAIADDPVSMNEPVSIQIVSAPIQMDTAVNLLERADTSVGVFTNTVFGVLDFLHCPPSIEIRVLVAQLDAQDIVENEIANSEIRTRIFQDLSFEFRRISHVLDSVGELTSNDCEAVDAGFGPEIRRIATEFEQQQN